MANKNRYYIFAMLFIAVIIFACSPKNTKKQKVMDEGITGLQTEFETTDSKTASIPDAILADSALNYYQFTPAGPPAQNFFEHMDYERRTFSEIKIWGWSKDGKVAYSNFASLEAAFFYVFIFDIVNDKILWQDSLDLLGDTQDYEAGQSWFDGKLYLGFIDAFKNICVQNKIEFVKTEFKDIPIKHNNQTVNIILEKNESPLIHQEGDASMIIGKYESYKVIAENQGKKKIIKEKEFNSEGNHPTIYADDVFICGYFMSPFENRALIVIGEFAHSWEGSDVTYSFAGCHLSMGFR